MFNIVFRVYSPSKMIILSSAISTAFSIVWSALSLVLPSLVSKPLVASTYMIDSAIPATVNGISLNALAQVTLIISSPGAFAVYVNLTRPFEVVDLALSISPLTALAYTSTSGIFSPKGFRAFVQSI